MGTWLAVWDRWAGTWLPATEPPEEFGLTGKEQNHNQDLISSIVSPIRGIFTPSLTALFLVGSLFSPSLAMASDEPVNETGESTQEPPEEIPDDEEAASEDVVVLGDTRTWGQQPQCTALSRSEGQ